MASQADTPLHVFPPHRAGPRHRHHRVCTMRHVARHARTGDLVLFSGIGLLSETVRYASRSRWSHVGVLLRLHLHEHHEGETRKKHPHGEVFVLESSNNTSMPDLLNGHLPHTGVHLWPLRRLQEYNGYAVAWRPLHVPDGWRRQAAWQEQTLLFVQQMTGRYYDTHLRELLHSSDPAPRDELRRVRHDGTGLAPPRLYEDVRARHHLLDVTDRRQAQEVFCVELVVLYYQAMGLVSAERPAEHYNLDDLYEGGGEHDTKIVFRYEGVRLAARSCFIVECFDDYYPRDDESAEDYVRREGAPLARRFTREFAQGRKPARLQRAGPPKRTRRKDDEESSDSSESDNEPEPKRQPVTPLVPVLPPGMPELNDLAVLLRVRPDEDWDWTSLAANPSVPETMLDRYIDRLSFSDLVEERRSEAFWERHAARWSSAPPDTRREVGTHLLTWVSQAFVERHQAALRDADFPEEPPEQLSEAFLLRHVDTWHYGRSRLIAYASEPVVRQLLTDAHVRSLVRNPNLSPDFWLELLRTDRGHAVTENWRQSFVDTLSRNPRLDLAFWQQLVAWGIAQDDELGYATGIPESYWLQRLRAYFPAKSRFPMTRLWMNLAERRGAAALSEAFWLEALALSKEHDADLHPPGMRYLFLELTFNTKLGDAFWLEYLDRVDYRRLLRVHSGADAPNPLTEAFWTVAIDRVPPQHRGRATSYARVSLDFWERHLDAIDWEVAQETSSFPLEWVLARVPADQLDYRALAGRGGADDVAEPKVPLPFEFAYRHRNQIDWEVFSYWGGFTYRDVLAHPRLPWDFDVMSSHTFGHPGRRTVDLDPRTLAALVVMQRWTGTRDLGSVLGTKLAQRRKRDQREARRLRAQLA